MCCSIVFKFPDAAQLAVKHDSHNEIVSWLKQFITRHKEIVITRNQDLMECDDDNKENTSS
jgi:hypothetical protein